MPFKIREGGEKAVGTAILIAFILISPLLYSFAYLYVRFIHK